MRARRVVWTSFTLIAAGAGLVLLAACASMDKERIEAELMELDGKALVRDAGVRTVVGELDVDGEPRQVEMRYLRVDLPGSSSEPAPPLVLVHGTPGSLFDWELLLGELEQRELERPLTVLALDLVGHGITREKAPPYSFELGARWIEAFLAALDLERVTLVGHSYGGEMVWRAALNAPRRIGAVVLVDSAGHARPEGGFLPEEEAMRENPFARIGYLLNSEKRIERALAPHYADGVPAERVREVYLLCKNADNWRAMVDLARDENGTRQGELGQLSQPTLLVWGENDLAYPVERVAQRFERELPDARLVVIGNTGHYPHEERAAEVAAALIRFIEELPAER